MEQSMEVGEGWIRLERNPDELVRLVIITPRSTAGVELTDLDVNDLIEFLKGS